MQDLLKKVFSYKCSKYGYTHTEDRGSDIFYYLYSNRDKDLLVSNPWVVDLAKLVVPNVFVEPKLIRFLSTYYHPNSMIVETTEWKILVDISQNFIISYFDLNRNAFKEINLTKFEDEYDRKKLALRKEEVPRYRKKMY